MKYGTISICLILLITMVYGQTEETKINPEDVFAAAGIKVQSFSWLAAEQRQEALDELSALTLDEVQLEAEGLTIMISYCFACLPGLITIDYRASLPEMKQFIVKNVNLARQWVRWEETAGQAAEVLEKNIKEKGLNISQSLVISNEEYLQGLMTLNQLSKKEIKKLGLKDREVVISCIFRVSDDGGLRIDYRAPLEMIKYFLANY